MVIYCSRSSNIFDSGIGKDVWFRSKTFNSSYLWIHVVRKDGNTYICNTVSDIILRRLENMDIDKRKTCIDAILRNTTRLSLDGIVLPEAQNYKDVLTTDELFNLV